MESFYWYDLETSGIDPRCDRIMQFAGQRTDLNLNPIADPDEFYGQLPADCLADPQACLITGITPQYVAEHGLVEAELSREIQRIFNQPQSCVVGFNSISFDDEFIRYLFYRNLTDPYAREWQNGNSRWDLLNLVRATHALRPDGIKWPQQDQRVSMRLELLSAANGLAHEHAHDALSDVYASIEMAKLIRSKQRRLFDYYFSLRAKSKVLALIDLKKHQPLVHTAVYYGEANGYTSLVMPIARSQHNANAIICYDLAKDPDELISVSADELRARRFNEGFFALSQIAVNRCPMLAPVSVLDQRSAARLGLDLPQCRRHYDRLLQTPELSTKVQSLFDGFDEDEIEDDCDLMLYSGGFFSDHDKKLMQACLQAPIESIAAQQWEFEDSRLDEMLFRYRARNFPDTLSADERDVFAEYCWYALCERGGEDLNDYFSLLSTLEQQLESASSETAKPETAKQKFILAQLRQYAENLVHQYGRA